MQHLPPAATGTATDDGWVSDAGSTEQIRRPRQGAPAIPAGVVLEERGKRYTLMHRRYVEFLIVEVEFLAFGVEILTFSRDFLSPMDSIDLLLCRGLFAEVKTPCTMRQF